MSHFVDTTHPLYDERIAAALNRVRVYLPDGRSAVLVCWQRNAGKAKVFVDGRHQWVGKDDIVWTDNSATPRDYRDAPATTPQGQA